VGPGRVMNLDHIKQVGVWDGLGKFRKAKLKSLKAQYSEWISDSEPRSAEEG